MNRFPAPVHDALARWPAAIFALLTTFVFFYPSLINHSVDAGFLYSGDILGYYLPALAKTHALVSRFHFAAIDYSLFNGSSDFFLAPNFFACHPLVVLYALLVPLGQAPMEQLARFLVLLLAFHAFLANYFGIMLMRRYFGFGFAAAAAVGAGFAFSGHVIGALGQPPFLLSVAVLPWAAYAALRFGETPDLRRFVLGCLPSIMGLLGGYLPLGVATVGLAAVACAGAVVLRAGADDRAGSGGPRESIRAISLSLLPIIGAFVLTAPYLVAALMFHGETSSADVPSLFYSAHQLAEAPHLILRGLSSRLDVPGATYEFSFSFGLIAIAVTALFLLVPGPVRALSPYRVQLLASAAVVYVATLLATFGQFSVVSDLVYYFVPQVGTMHIYQRFLLPAQLALAVVLAIMLEAVLDAPSPTVARWGLVLCALAAVAVGHVVGREPALSRQLGVNEYIVFELILAGLFFAVLLLPCGRTFTFVAAGALYFLPTLDRMYDLSAGANRLEVQKKRQVMSLDAVERAKVLAFMRSRTDKKVIKVADLTPMWTADGIETFPKVFPWLVLGDAVVSSYGGFTFYLSARYSYLSRMSIDSEVAVRADWELLRASGADFAVVRNAQLTGDDAVAQFARTEPAAVYSLPNGASIVALAKILTLPRPPEFDNGYFRVSPQSVEVERNLALGKPARQNSDGGGSASLAVDGNTNGDFAAGSVSHTGLQRGAWLDIDLGSVARIDQVRIWNRTDCCASRLRDYWIFISATPFLDSDTVGTLKARPATFGRAGFMPSPKATMTTSGFPGRYVRIQLGGSVEPDQSYLSLAEVEVIGAGTDEVALPAKPMGVSVSSFTSNDADRMRVEVESAVPARVQYLFWDNPRIKFLLNGAPVEKRYREDYVTIDVPAGRNVIEVRYRHPWLTGFWTVALLYVLALIWAVFPANALGWLGRRIRPQSWAWPRR